MAIVTCKLCGKIFTSAGAKVCPECFTKLDGLYMRARDVLRDNPKLVMNIEDLAEAMNEEPKYIQALVDMGYMERDAGLSAKLLKTPEKENLIKDLERSLNKMKESSAQRDAAKNAARSYGQQRYGESGKR
ncbi:MAG: hypothetical protein LBR38_01245 [Synergistaceae bacterium]|nr:hypothetical protein [Synergistaceae bacterium]